MQDKNNVLIIGNCVYLHPIHTTQPKSVATHSDKNASKHNIIYHKNGHCSQLIM
jgi:hypothetical protein